MSGLGKAFTILVLLASIVYLWLTSTLFAYRTDYKAALLKEKNDHKDKVAKEDAEIQKKDAEIKSKDLATLSALAAQNKALADEKVATDEQKVINERTGKLDGDIGKLKGEYDKIKGQIDKKQEVIAALTTQRDAALKEKTEADAARDEANKKLTEAQNRLQGAEKNLQDLEKSYIQKVKELEAAKGKLSMVPPDAIPPEARTVKAIDGKILAVSKTMNLLIVNVGKEKGVEVGDQFTVYRGDKFVGKIQVEKADKDWSSARMVLDFKRLDPVVGDDVSSRAN